LVWKRRVVWRWFGRLLQIAAWLNLACLLCIWALLRFSVDAWWPGTLLAFGPRWIWGVPSLALIAPTLLGRRRLLPVVAVALVVWAGPVLGLVVPWPWPWRHLLASTPEAAPVRVLTHNVGGVVEAGRFGAMMLREEPDVVALQECGGDFLRQLTDDPRIAGRWPYWVSRREHAILSRFPLDDVRALCRRMYGERGRSALGCCVVTPGGRFPLVTLHLTSISSGLTAFRSQQLSGVPTLEHVSVVRERESRGAARWIADNYPDGIVAGDFNMMTESRNYRRDWNSYDDAFSAVGWGYGSTWRSRWHGLAIDHVLCGPSQRPVACRVLPGVGGDHRPVLADIVPSLSHSDQRSKIAGHE
jgi:vancomycin resistance protein VanJ